MDDIPPFLQAARARADQARARAASPSPTTSTPTPPPPPQASSSTPPPATAAQNSNQPEKPANRRKGKGGNRSKSVAATSAISGSADWDGLADRVVAESADAEAAALVRPQLPVILQALCAGASMPGSVGAADRSMVFRLIRHSSSTAREQAQAARGLAKALGEGLGAALDRARVARSKVIEGEIGRVPVTLDVPERQKP